MLSHMESLVMYHAWKYISWLYFIPWYVEGQLEEREVACDESILHIYTFSHKKNGLKCDSFGSSEATASTFANLLILPCGLNFLKTLEDDLNPCLRRMGGVGEPEQYNLPTGKNDGKVRHLLNWIFVPEYRIALPQRPYLRLLPTEFGFPGERDFPRRVPRPLNVSQYSTVLDDRLSFPTAPSSGISLLITQVPRGMTMRSRCDCIAITFNWVSL